MSRLGDFRKQVYRESHTRKCCRGIRRSPRDIPPGELKHNVVALAKAARVLKLPLVVTTTTAARGCLRRARYAVCRPCR